MLQPLHRTECFLIAITVAVLLTGCTLTAAQPTPTATQPPPTATVTEPAPTETPVPPTPTWTPSPSATEVPTETFTPTPVPPLVEITQNAVCRTGPGLVYKVIEYFTPGDQASPSGFVDTDPRWWFITWETEDGEKACWISDEVVTASGSVDSLPTLTPPPLPTASPTPTFAQGGIYYFLVAENTGGPFGCGDGLVRIYPGIPRTGKFSQDITAALNALFSNHREYYNGFYNPMHASSLRVGDVDPPASSGGDTNIHLSGDLVRPEDKCESKRMHDQVWETIYQQFSDTNHVVIRVNRGLLDDLLVVTK